MTTVLELFTELCATPSPPGEERAVADRVIRELEALGLEVEEDDAGAEIGSTIGNLLCRLPGRIEGGTGPGAGAGFSGAAGIMRLFNTEMGGQIGWLLPAALMLLVAGGMLQWLGNFTPLFIFVRRPPPPRACSP